MQQRKQLNPKQQKDSVTDRDLRAARRASIKEKTLLMNLYRPKLSARAKHTKNLGHPGLERPVKAPAPTKDTAAPTPEKTHGIPFAEYVTAIPIFPTSHVVPDSRTIDPTTGYPFRKVHFEDNSVTTVVNATPPPLKTAGPSAYFSQATVNRQHPPATPLVGNEMNPMNIARIVTSPHSLIQ